MTRLACLIHSSSVFHSALLSSPLRSSSYTSISISSASFSKTGVLTSNHGSSTTLLKALKPELRGGVDSFEVDISERQTYSVEEKDREHEIQSSEENEKNSQLLSPGTKKTQDALLTQIAAEVRRKREGDKEATPVVRALTWACREVTEAADVNALVGDLDLAHSVFTTAIQKLGIEKRPQAAVAVFQWMQRFSGRLPNVFPYNSLMGALKATGCYELAQGVYDEMQLNGVLPDIVTYNTLISLYEIQGRFDDSVEVYDNLRRRGVEPSLYTFRNIIQILGKKGDVGTALNVFREFKEQQRRIDAKVIEVVELKRYSQQRKELEKMIEQMCCKRFVVLISRDRKLYVEETLRFLDRLKRSEVQLGFRAYERLILACGGKEQDHQVVKVLFADMRRLQLQIRVGVGNHVIRVLGQGKMWGTALEIYEQMVEIGPEPDGITYKLLLSHFKVLLNAARDRKLWKWSVHLLDKMVAKGVEPDTFAWNACLISCAKAGETDAAVLVFQKMIERGQRPGILSYGALLSALEKSSSLSAAELVWEHMRKVELNPNNEAYTTMISLYGKVGKYSEVMRMVKEMREGGIEPSLITFNALITACARAGDSERALDWVEQMKAAWIQPDAVTYAQVIEAFANEGKWEPATAAYAKVQELQLELPNSAYDAVVRACKANNVEFNPASDEGLEGPQLKRPDSEGILHQKVWLDVSGNSSDCRRNEC